MDLNLTNKTALVCGASQGLGLACATELALLGASVIIASRSDDKLRSAVKHLDTSKGQKHEFLVLDLAQPEEVKKTVMAFISKGNTIHILVNNAGGPPSAPMIDTDPAEMEKAFRTHVISSHVLAQLLVAGMIKAGFGRIVNIVSTAVKQPIDGLGISNLVRAAVANWAKTLANEMAGYGITVNNVLPGYTNTDRLNYLFSKQASDQGLTKEDVFQKTIASIPAKRVGEPAEFGAAVAFLCSPAAAYINGINLPVDGGRTGGL
ncbi:SDR family oxidoreductase [Segetibacter sp.]|jgi:3-oxoacyl-[acyl-carrier protein] reductase|uniref:SDR family oxidoreductase n=1 Tax=Segetibacter sp. TaxID=2231182 RepID=UPI0026164761|nr:SDR family oxidoreductase [Segetibacter sp.]MCW3082571.1 3-oxoacyl-[acyl-carrier protein] reductase [Segetibacter sp.]